MIHRSKLSRSLAVFETSAPQIATSSHSKAADANQYKRYTHYDEKDAVTECQAGARLRSRQQGHYRDNYISDGHEGAHNQSAKA